MGRPEHSDNSRRRTTTTKTTRTTRTKTTTTTTTKGMHGEVNERPSPTPTACDPDCGFDSDFDFDSDSDFDSGSEYDSGYSALSRYLLGWLIFLSVVTSSFHVRVVAVVES
jgi:hypothetical protein